jgi:hypothetical protein
MIHRWKGRWGERVISEWWTNRLKAMAYSLRAFDRAMAAGDISHSGDQVYAQHIANARRRKLKMLDENGQVLWVIEKERHDSPFKIDAAIAGDLSWEARCDAIAAGVNRKKSSQMIVMRR